MTLFETLRDRILPSDDVLDHAFCSTGSGTFTEEPTINAWNEPIPPRKYGVIMRELDLVDVDKYVKNPKQLHVHTFNSNCMTALMLFTETGLSTKMTYQPDCNHRKFDIGFFYTERWLGGG